MALDRRSFLKGTAGLTFFVGAGGASAVRTEAATGALDVNMWLTIHADGKISIIHPSTEMGQGSYSTLPMFLAEELDVAWDDVEIVQLNADDRRFGNQLFGGVLYTAGSTGTQFYFEPMRRAGAQARDVLLQIAARDWGVEKSALTTKPSVVFGPDGQTASFGELAALGADGLAVPAAEDVSLKDMADFRYIGHHVPRRDIPAKSTGKAVYAIDVDVPNMAYGAVLRAPVEDEVPVSVNDASAREIPGVIDVVTLPDGVAVIAESLWAALGARGLLEVEWSQTSPFRSSNSDETLSQYAAAASAPGASGAVWEEKGDASVAIAGADKQFSQLYLSDYAY
ncbi:MAG: molybdopterin cofactor-binding domain-containing protein, partial [Pseudomonadota bacterium]